MPDKGEKARRKEILNSLRENERRSVREALPVSPVTMKALFDYIDEHLSSAGCDHTLRLTREFIHANNLPEQKVVEWLEGAGGYCDCEELDNGEPLLEDSIPGYSDTMR